MAYPYDDMQQALGRPLTPDEQMQVQQKTATGGKPAMTADGTGGWGVGLPDQLGGVAGPGWQSGGMTALDPTGKPIAGPGAGFEGGPTTQPIGTQPGDPGVPVQAIPPNQGLPETPWGGPKYNPEPVQAIPPNQPMPPQGGPTRGTPPEPTQAIPPGQEIPQGPPRVPSPEPTQAIPPGQEIPQGPPKVPSPEPTQAIPPNQPGGVVLPSNPKIGPGPMMAPPEPTQGIPPNQPGTGGNTGGLPATIPDAPGFAAPTLELPESLTPPDEYEAERITAPAPYTALTAEQLAQDPSYQWRLDQGRKAMEASAAAGGTLRGGATLKGLIDYGQNAASQEYAAADARNRANYGLNWDVQTGAFDRNTAGSRDARDFNWNAKTGTYDRNVDAADRKYTADFRGREAEYAPRFASWDKRTDNAQRNAELMFDRDWQKEIYNRDDAFRNKTYDTDDAYRKTVFMADDNFRKTVYGTDDAFRKAVQAESDAWKREVMEEERRRWLAEMGAQ
jgi:hypothetical protein